MKILKSKEGIFYIMLGNIDEPSYFAFNNIDALSEEKNYIKKIYENNIRNFRSLLK